MIEIFAEGMPTARQSPTCVGVLSKVISPSWMLSWKQRQSCNVVSLNWVRYVPATIITSQGAGSLGRLPPWHGDVP